MHWVHDSHGIPVREMKHAGCLLGCFMSGVDLFEFGVRSLAFNVKADGRTVCLLDLQCVIAAAVAIRLPLQ